jgi:hypothetical protein
MSYEDDVEEKIDMECDACGLPMPDCECDEIARKAEPQQ